MAIKKYTAPGKGDCTKCIDESTGILSSRKWTDAKFYVKNHITKFQDFSGKT